MKPVKVYLVKNTDGATSWTFINPKDIGTQDEEKVLKSTTLLQLLRTKRRELEISGQWMFLLEEAAAIIHRLQNK